MRGTADTRIGIVGLGYVGLPLAVEFGRKYPTVGFDVSGQRIRALQAGRDSTREATRTELKGATQLSFTDLAEDLADCNVFIVTVPTPVDRYKRPDLEPLLKASESVGRVMKKGAIVVFESTVYPGCTEEVCVPVLQRFSKLRYNKGFFCGYSPERINPGDRQHRLTSIKKVVAGSTPRTADFLNSLYSSIIHAGTHRASSIRVAEAAKVIENIQRDVNIALINELALIFKRMDIDTEEVLEAAGTKWNFLPFRPGLVGGHCIGVDPYYLTHKATEIGYHPEIILAGRRINDGMGAYVAQQVIKLMTERRILVAGSRILMLGLTFKENCPDLRNSKVIDIIGALRQLNARVDVWDPWVDPRAANREYGLLPIASPKRGTYDAVVLAVSHDVFRSLGIEKIRRFAKSTHVVYDVKYMFAREHSDGRL